MRNAAAPAVRAGNQLLINAVIGRGVAGGAHETHAARISTGLAQHPTSSKANLTRFFRARKARKKSAQEKRPRKAPKESA